MAIDSLTNLTDFAQTPPGGSNTQIQFNNNNEFGASSTFVFDGSNVGIGIANPLSPLHILSQGTTRGITPNAVANEAYFEDGTTDSGITIGSGNTNNGFILFADTDSNAIGQIKYNHTDDSLAFYTAAAEKMRIDSAGNVGIGNTSPDHIFHVEDIGVNSYATKIVFDLEGTRKGGYTQSTLELSTYAGGHGSPAWRTVAIANELNGPQNDADMVFYHEGTELMRIKSTGHVGVNSPSNESPLSTTQAGAAAIVSGYIGAAGNGTGPGFSLLRSNVIGTNGGSGMLNIVNAACGGGFYIRVDKSTAHPNQGGSYTDGFVVLGSDSSTQDGWFFNMMYGGTYQNSHTFTAAGQAYNLTGTWGTGSDERIKDVVGPASSQWNDIKSLNFVKYKLKKDVSFEASEENDQNFAAPTYMGLIAQEVETTSPYLVDETLNNDETLDIDKIKVVKTSILYMKAVKCLQEAMARIEELESKVEALSG